jgi:hypothetical protein
MQLAPSGILPSVAAGVLGGFVAGLFAPRHKVIFAASVGLSLTVALLGSMAARRMYADGRNPFIWYWPAYFVLSFILGGFLSRKLWRGAA